MTIGGALEDDRNLISGDSFYGVFIDPGSSQNVVEGNYIGTTANGLSIPANSTVTYGIAVLGDDNTIGGAAGSGNVIAGAITSSAAGIDLAGNFNTIESNDIGVGIDGVTPLANQYGIFAGGFSNQIGDTSGDGNLVENSLADGIYFYNSSGTSVPDSIVQGNTIEASGSVGIVVADTIESIGGNTISGNVGGGLSISGTSTLGTAVIGNTLVGNGPFGVELSSGANHVQIGDSLAGAGNVISGNASGVGVLITDSGTGHDVITGNTITRDYEGIEIFAGATADILFGNSITANTDEGVVINGKTSTLNILQSNTISGNAGGVEINSPDNQVGGPGVGDGNILFGNGILFNSGVNLQIDGPFATSNLTEGNIVGYDPTTFIGSSYYGIVLSGGAQSNTITGNVVSSNADEPGIDIEGFSTDSNIISNNFVGTDPTGTRGLFNDIGLQIDGGASINTISGNVISGNSNQGVYIHDSGTVGNVLSGNIIGANAAGTGTLQFGSSNDGVGVEIGLGASSNTVTHSLISGNYGGNILIDGAGTSTNTISFDMIGTDNTGEVALPSPGFTPVDGVVISSGATTNFIGPGDVISGNTSFGVVITDAGTSGNIVYGDFIGTDALGSLKIPNVQDGIEIAAGATGNTIGGLTSTPGTGLGNLISGNDDTSANETDGGGVLITGPGTSSNAVEGNLIGLNVAGTGALGNYEGVVISYSASNNTVGGITSGASNEIGGNDRAVWIIFSSSANVIEGNFIGTNAAGATGLGNTYDGVEISQSGTGNIVGGTVVGASNVIAGNAGDGLFIYATPGVVVQGNYIGTNAAGKAGLGNAANGIDIQQDCPNITIGGVNVLNPDGTIKLLIGNVISANATTGISDGSPSSGLIEGNLIGTDPTGNTRMGNHYYGILIGATGATIGGTTPGAGNLISGNSSVQVFIDGVNNNSKGDLVEGNTIGTNYAGTLAIADTAADGTGVDIYDAAGNTVGGTAAGAGNLISGHVQWGISIDTGSTGNLVEGNEIGTNLAGNAALPNGGQVNPGTPSGGINVNAAPGNTIGGNATGAGNLISGNANAGIYLNDGSTTLIEGNLIGTDLNGKLAVPNATGIFLTGGSSANTIGGTTSGERNVISGNTNGYGVEFQYVSLSDDNLIEGNYVGVNITGNATLPNGYGIFLDGGNVGNTVGGTAAGAGNVITGNNATSGYGKSQLYIAGSSNLVEGNLIGLFANGLAPASSIDAGIFINNPYGPGANTIGGVTASARNVISGNYVGIAIVGGGLNLVEGNYVGTDENGTVAIGNGLVTQTGADDIELGVTSNNTIGGNTPAARNIIAGSASFGLVFGTGATDNLAEGNYIGTDKTGTVALPNYAGIDLGSDSNNTIGGTTSRPGTGAGNLIAGNTFGINTDVASGDVIEGNAIGIVALISGGMSPGNGNDGIEIYGSPSSGIQIGGPSPMDENVISGNGAAGIEINSSSAVLVEGNLIGTDINGKLAVPNTNGVFLDGGSSGNTIGGTLGSTGNVISGNTDFGIEISSNNAVLTDDLIQGNLVGVDITGNAALPNAYGIVDDLGLDDTIGGTAAGQGNVISGNDGPYVFARRSSGRAGGATSSRGTLSASRNPGPRCRARPSAGSSCRQGPAADRSRSGGPRPGPETRSRETSRGCSSTPPPWSRGISSAPT